MADNTKTSSNSTSTTATNTPMTYAQSGVDIAAGDTMVGMIQSNMRKTHGPRVIDVPGGFANLFRLDYNEKLFRRNYRDPVLVACTDGVGTKVKLAIDMGIYHTIGVDCVAMSVNDLIVQGAEPLFFLDYLAVHKLDPKMGEAIVRGVAFGCEQSGCALIGGETAEMSDLYKEGDFDLAGFAVGVVELERAIDPSRVETGDIIIGLPSDGLHSNGFTLVRKLIENANLKLDDVIEELIPTNHPIRPSPTNKSKDRTAPLGASGKLGEVLLTPTRLYAEPIVRLLRKYKVKKVVSGMAHITGGGLPGNVNRALSDDLDAIIETNTWDQPPIFAFLQNLGNIETDEMYHVFNMGIGYVLIVRPAFAHSVVRHLIKLGQPAIEIGRVVRGTGKVHLEH